MKKADGGDYARGYADGFSAGLAAARKALDALAEVRAVPPPPPAESPSEVVSQDGAQRLLYTRAEAAYALHMSGSRVQKLIARGEIGIPAPDGILSMKIGGVPAHTTLGFAGLYGLPRCLNGGEHTIRRFLCAEQIVAPAEATDEGRDRHGADAFTASTNWLGVLGSSRQLGRCQHPELP